MDTGSKKKEINSRYNKINYKSNDFVRDNIFIKH